MILKANELRLGNWVTLLDITQRRRPIQINARFFSALAGGRAVHELNPEEELSEWWQPIPITPEILERAGFRRYLDIYSDGHIAIQIRKTIDGSEMYVVPNDMYCFALKYLHQLQNLYFALRGEELNVTLN